MTMIPTIEFSKEADIKPSSASWDLVRDQVRCALEEHGCFLAVYPQVSRLLCRKIFSQSKDLFELPTETKKKNISEEPYRGYIGPSPLMPLYEGIAIDNATSFEETQKFMNLMWPQGKEGFCEVVNSYAKLLAELEEMVLQMLFESYGATKHYDSIVASNSHLLRFLKYRKPEDKKTETRFASHTDKDFVTIVFQDHVGGLEVQTKDGHWISIDPAPSTFLFMASDGLQLWSNDRIKACYHRVKNCGNEERYSLGLFTFNNGVIEVPEELVDEGHPLLYNPCDSRGFLRYYLTDQAKKVDCPLKAYCGTY
ncbi:hypothetical protein UlMin_026145 [Ulmus minor]